MGISDVSGRTLSQSKWSQVSNLTKERQDILNYLGKVCGQYYLIVEDG